MKQISFGSRDKIRPTRTARAREGSALLHAAFGAGFIREEYGTYAPAFLISGVFGLIAALSFVTLGSIAGHAKVQEAV